MKKPKQLPAFTGTDEKLADLVADFTGARYEKVLPMPTFDVIDLFGYTLTPEQRKVFVKVHLDTLQNIQQP